MTEPKKDETPAAPIDPQNTQEPTPIGDEAEKAAAHLKDVDEGDVTRFEEDDDPQSLVGDVVEEEN